MIAFVVVTGVDAFHIDFAVIDFFGQSSVQQRFYLHILDRAALHRKKVIFFIHPAPVDDLMQFFFQNSIQPDSGASAIALPNGCATFISGAKRKFPFAMFTVRICPANS